MKSTFAPFARPLYVMSKPIGSACNLACDYCYYLEKSHLYKQNPKQVMTALFSFCRIQIFRVLPSFFCPKQASFQKSYKTLLNQT